MSSSITQCPDCYTRFRVTSDQLSAHDGIVRCGRCSAIFNATEHLHDDEPSPQLNLPIAQTDSAETHTKGLAEVQTSDEFIASTDAADEVETLIQQIVSVDELPPEEIDIPQPKRRKWPWIVGSLLLLLVGLAQACYFFRVEIAARLPGSKPALTSYCDLLKCAIPLPAKVDLMSIESSDLEADPLQQNVIILSAQLHNRAEYTQAYPSLELSLTDTQDKVLARRVFSPAEYLHGNDNEKLGLGGNRELNIQLHLDSSDLRPMGYKLLMFFPTNR